MSVVNVRQKYLLNPAKGQKSYPDIKEWLADDNNLYIGRGMGKPVVKGSKWSNPFANARTSVNESLVLYKKHVLESSLNSQIEEIRGKNLGCWCVTDTCEDCHGNVLLEILRDKDLERGSSSSEDSSEDSSYDPGEILSSQEIAQLDRKQRDKIVKEIKSQHPIDDNEKMDPQARDMLLEVNDTYDAVLGSHDPDIRGADYNEDPGNSVGLLEPDTSRLSKSSSVKNDEKSADKVVLSLFDSEVEEQKAEDKEIRKLANRDYVKEKELWLVKADDIFRDLERFERLTIVNSFMNKQFYGCSYRKEIESNIEKLQS